jgi:DNA helicase-2/ATP-dependent DNA helicase PcrA
VLTGAARRRVFGEYQSTEPSRFLNEIPAELIDVLAPSSSGYQGGSPYYEFRTNPYGRGGRRGGRTREEGPAYAYEDEDQSASGIRLGARVRHAQFGVGTVVGVEGADADLKLTVRFPIGQKKLIARYAKLELV